MNYNFLTYRYELIFVLSLLLIIVGGNLARRWWHRATVASRKLRVLQLAVSGGDEFAKCVAAMVPPFVFEIAVHQLGAEKAYYIIVPEKRVSDVVKTLGALAKVEVIDDYSFFNVAGVHRGFVVSGKLEHEISQTISFQNAISMMESLNYATVNEIGEGVVAQCLVRRTVGEHVEVNARLVVTGPTKEAVDESVASIQTSVPKQYQLAEAKEKTFFERVALRSFDAEKSHLWKR